jgi:hypothetical protein
MTLRVTAARLLSQRYRQRAPSADAQAAVDSSPVAESCDLCCSRPNQVKSRPVSILKPVGAVTYVQLRFRGSQSGCVRQAASSAGICWASYATNNARFNVINGLPKRNTPPDLRSTLWRIIRRNCPVLAGACPLGAVGTCVTCCGACFSYSGCKYGCQRRQKPFHAKQLGAAAGLCEKKHELCPWVR